MISELWGNGDRVTAGVISSEMTSVDVFMIVKGSMLSGVVDFAMLEWVNYISDSDYSYSECTYMRITRMMLLQ